MNSPNEHAERFTLLRPLLFTIAYEILGSATESDDVLQESYLRWAEVELSAVRDTKSYLAQVVTRQALNVLRSRTRRREEYVGPWLPEPLLLAPDAAADVVLAESVSMGMLILLETLTPEERAVFVLHEVFGFEHDEIAGAVGKSASAVRQLAYRARGHVHARRNRFGPVDTARTGELTDRFLNAAATGDLDGLLALLAPDVHWTTDSGGKAFAVRELLMTGATRVAVMLVTLMKAIHRLPDTRIEQVHCNSDPAVAIYRGERLEAVVVLEFAGGKIINGYGIRNPDKLAALGVTRVISRTAESPDARG
ncbi:RNA polymerase sigma factor SigJ [Nocardia sp. NPDC057668]|uniref:RNA polymerase sigma factor SigJ n=1 Tax=Nocardia sp. NPDC057668 TaxID=3346202 RepID=UPI0036729549